MEEKKKTPEVEAQEQSKNTIIVVLGKSKVTINRTGIICEVRK